MKTIEINKKKHYIEIYFKKKNRFLTFYNFYSICQNNKKEFPNDEDIRTKGWFGLRTNGAKRKTKDSCLDVTIGLGYVEINYTNYEFNKKYRRGLNK